MDHHEESQPMEGEWTGKWEVRVGELHTADHWVYLQTLDITSSMIKPLVRGLVVEESFCPNNSVC